MTTVKQTVKVKNAKIESTFLGFEDHNIFTCFLDLNYGGIGQSLGGYSLGSIDFLKKVLDVVGVRKWEDLPGKYIRVRTVNSKIIAFANILEDNWHEFSGNPS